MSRGSGGAVPPRVVWEQVVEALRAAGDGTHVRRVEPVRGGMESHAFRVTTSKGAYFLKWSERLAPDRYGREARGLALLRESGAVRVPHVLAAQDVRRAADGTASAPGFFLMEWL